MFLQNLQNILQRGTLLDADGIDKKKKIKKLKEKRMKRV